jgi:hypothetical protein
MNESRDPVEQLLEVPPSEFVSARNRLAAELKKTDGKEAARVKALPKPSPSVWVLNRVAHRSPDKIDAFLRACDALERAQAGRGTSDDSRRAYQSALTEQREALDRVVTTARDVLAAAGQPASRAVLERVTDNLRWAVVEGDTRELLEEGRLSRDLEAPDFSALIGRIPLAGRGPRPTPPEQGTEKKKTAASGDKSISAAERAGRGAAEKRLGRLKERLAEAQDEVAAARADLRKAKAAHDEAQKALVTLRREMTTAERSAAVAERAHGVAESTLAERISQQERAAAEVTEAEKEIARRR